jgi:hypothetical protein
MGISKEIGMYNDIPTPEEYQTELLLEIIKHIKKIDSKLKLFEKILIGNRIKS